MRSLAQRIRSGTAAEPLVFVYGVNVPGLDWYLSRLIHVSEDRVDHLLPPTPAQQARLLSSPGQCSTLAPPGQQVFGVVQLRKVGLDWPTNTWRVVATAGSSALIQRMEVAARDSSKPPVPLACMIHEVSIGAKPKTLRPGPARSRPPISVLLLSQDCGAEGSECSSDPETACQRRGLSLPDQLLRQYRGRTRRVFGVL